MRRKLTDAGRRDRLVTIVRQVTSGTDSWGDPVPSSETETERWAAVTPSPGTERFANAENAATAPIRFVFRWEDDLVRVTDTLRHDDGREYDVKSVTEIGRREGWEVLAVARAEPA